MPIITKEALKQLVKEAFDNDGFGVSHSSVCNVSTNADQQAIDTERFDSDYKPRTGEELKKAIVLLANSIGEVQDEKATQAYNTVKDALEMATETGKENVNVTEQAIRAAVRRSLMEAMGVKDNDVCEVSAGHLDNAMNVCPNCGSRSMRKTYVNGGPANVCLNCDWAETLQENANAPQTRDQKIDAELAQQNLRRANADKGESGWFVIVNVPDLDGRPTSKVWATDDAEQVNERSVPVDVQDDEEDGEEKKKERHSNKEGASFKEIAQELGFSVAGAKSACDRAMRKAQYIAKIDPDDLQLMTLYAVKDYAELLNSSGELSEEEYQLLLNEPSLVADLDGFREFLAKRIKKEMELDGELDNAEAVD